MAFGVELGGALSSAAAVGGRLRQLDPMAKTGNPSLATGANCEKALRHRGGAAHEK